MSLLVVDGTHNGVQTGGPEARAPWFVFDVERQENRAGPYRWKWMAAVMLFVLFKGEV